MSLCSFYNLKIHSDSFIDNSDPSCYIITFSDGSAELISITNIKHIWRRLGERLKRKSNSQRVKTCIEYNILYICQNITSTDLSLSTTSLSPTNLLSSDSAKSKIHSITLVNESIVISFTNKKSKILDVSTLDDFWERLGFRLKSCKKGKEKTCAEKCLEYNILFIAINNPKPTKEKLTPKKKVKRRK